VSNVEGLEFFGIRPSSIIGHFMLGCEDGRAVEKVVRSATRTVDGLRRDFIIAALDFYGIIRSLYPRRYVAIICNAMEATFRHAFRCLELKLEKRIKHFW
jgi:hypothetical protein